MKLRRGLPKAPVVSTFFVQSLQDASTVDRRNLAQVTIDILPDLSLLNIFAFYVHEDLVSVDSVDVCSVSAAPRA